MRQKWVTSILDNADHLVFGSSSSSGAECGNPALENSLQGSAIPYS